MVLGASLLLSMLPAAISFRPVSSLTLINTGVSKLASVQRKHVCGHGAWPSNTADISGIPWKDGLSALFTHSQTELSATHSVHNEQNLFPKLHDICFPVILCANCSSGQWHYTGQSSLYRFVPVKTLLPRIPSMF